VNPSFEILDSTEKRTSRPASRYRSRREGAAPEMIRVSALDTTGKAVTFVAEDFHARVVLHESDHLDGVVYLDRVRDRTSIRYTVDF